MSQQSFDHDRLARWLDAYGSDPSRWPDDGRDAALALIDASPPARAMRDEAAGLDAFLALDRVAGDEPSPALRAAVLAAIPPRAAAPSPTRESAFARWRRQFDDALGGWQLAASALGLSAVLGVLLALDMAGVQNAEPDLLDLAQVQAIDLEY